jgi:hypothetical protein
MDMSKQVFPGTNDMYDGMTLREYYAGLAMQGFCANESVTDSQGDGLVIARAAVKHADALIAELNKEATK